MFWCFNFILWKYARACIMVKKLKAMFNSSFNVYKTEWLDLVFSDRNKNYGAYMLRAESGRTLIKALLIGSSLFILLFVSPFLYARLFPKPVEDTAKVIELSDPTIYQVKKPEVPEKVAAPKTAAEPVKAKTVNMVSKIVVTNEPVLQDPPTVNELKDAVVSNKTQDGEANPNLVVAETSAKGGNGSGLEEKAGTGTTDNEIIMAAEADEYPEFAGGMKAWSKYIQRNLNYPSKAQEEGIQGKVFISFVVERDGSITDVKVLRGIGAGCDEEAARVIQKSPKWKPGKNRGTPVRVRYNLPIDFTIF